MTTQRVELLDLDVALATAYSLLVSKSAAARSPSIVPGAAINWAWLTWKQSPEFSRISEVLSAATQQSATAEAADRAVYQDLRGDYEWLLISCAILSGDANIMRQAANFVGGADASTAGRRGYYLASVGILRARILGSRSDELAQAQLSEKHKPDGVHPLPSRQLLRAFVARDYESLNKQVATGAKKHWTDSYIGRAVVKESPDMLILDLSKKHSYFTWPYTEAVFAKLAILEGAAITHDDFWFPLEFVKSMRA